MPPIIVIIVFDFFALYGPINLVIKYILFYKYIFYLAISLKEQWRSSERHSKQIDLASYLLIKYMYKLKKKTSK